MDPYFAHATKTAEDLSFGPSIIEALRKDDHSGMADTLGKLGQGCDTDAATQR